MIIYAVYTIEWVCMHNDILIIDDQERTSPDDFSH